MQPLTEEPGGDPVAAADSAGVTGTGLPGRPPAVVVRNHLRRPPLTSPVAPEDLVSLALPFAAGRLWYKCREVPPVGA